MIGEWHNPVMTFLTAALPHKPALGHRASLDHARRRLAALGVSAYLAFSGVIGSEFLPHLDEGAIWARGTLADSTSLTEGENSRTKALVFASFPEVTKVVSQVGRPDDGTDTGGFGNTEYFVDLKPKDQWRPVFHRDKDELIAAMNREVDKIPGRDLELLPADRGQRRRDPHRHQRPTRAQDLRRRSEDSRGEGRRSHRRHVGASRACTTSSSYATSASRIST